MRSSSSWAVIFGADSSRTVLGVDFPARGPEGRRTADFTELATRMGSGYRFLRTKPPTGRPGQRLSGAAQVDSWIEGIRQDRHPVLAVLGYCVGSVYAAAIAEGISQWQETPDIILFEPQFASMKLLGRVFHSEISAISSLLSSDEIERARKIATEDSDSDSYSETRDVANVAAEMVESYLEVISAAFERAGLGDARNDELVTAFESYISWISAADQLDPNRAWKHSTAMVSSDYVELSNRASLADDAKDAIGRRIPFAVSHADLLRSDSVAKAVLDLLVSR